LVAASGTKGMTVSVWTVKGFFEGPPTYLVSVLRSLGYKARLEAYAGNRFGEIVGDSRQHVQADGPYPWGTDFPAASGFFVPFLTCATFKPGTTDNPNWGEFCDPQIDAEITRALSLQTSDPQAAALLWSKVDRDVVDEAPVVPFFNLLKLELVSTRVGNYTSSFLATGALLDQLWVK
jgi:peptide/nickel transport system substrate-binding protein